MENGFLHIPSPESGKGKGGVLTRKDKLTEIDQRNHSAPTFPPHRRRIGGG
jgi:hypothetical protein